MLVSAEDRPPPVLPERPGGRHRRAACLRRRRPGLAPALGPLPHPAARRPGHPAGRPVGDGGQPGGDAGVAVLRVGAGAAGHPAAARRPQASPRSNSITWARWPMRPRSSGCCTGARSGWSSATAGRRVEQLALLLREQEIETFVSHSSLGAEERRLRRAGVRPAAELRDRGHQFAGTGPRRRRPRPGDPDRRPADGLLVPPADGPDGAAGGDHVELPLPGDDRRGPAAGRGPARPLAGRASSSRCMPRPSRTTSWPSS